MFKNKRYLLLTLIIISCLMIPMSFAADVDEDNNSTIQSTGDINDLGIDDDLENVGSSSDDVISATHDYESTVTPDTVSYTKGESCEVTVTIKCDYLSDFSSAPMYVYINGDGANDRQVVNGVYGNKNTFTYDLSKISDKLNDGSNTLKFHIDESYLNGQWLSDFQYNPLIVNVGTNSDPYTGIIYVSSVGSSDDNDGSEEKPVATISKAIELATSSDNTEHSIVVNEGTYTLSNAKLSSDLTITGLGNVVIVPSGNNNHFELSGTANYYFNNLILVNGVNNGANPGSIKVGTSSKLYLNGCTFLNNTGAYYGIVYVNGGTVNAIGCNFVNNAVSSGSAALITTLSSGSAVATVNISYSNIIDNGGSTFSFLHAQQGTPSISVEYNYWGSNGGPTSNHLNVNSYKPTNWVNLIVEMDEQIITGQTYDVDIKFVDNDGNNLSWTLPDLTVYLSSVGTLNQNTVTISGNVAKVEYTAGSVGSDTFTVSHNDNTLTTLPITVESDKYTGIIYVDATASDDNVGSENSPVATISKAIELATSSDNTANAIVILEGNYKEYNLSISSSLTITGNGNVVIDADKKGRIFKITNGDVKLSNLTLINGIAPGDLEDPEVYWDTVYLNAGGAIFIKNGNVEIDNLKFINNTANDYGGAIYLIQNTTIINSTFENNSAEYGGAIYIAIADDYDYIGNTIQENTFINNNATLQGGAISIVYNGNENYVSFMEFDTIDSNNFNNNHATTGGAIANNGYKIIVSNNIFNANTANRGGAITNGKYVRLINNTITNCQASENGNDVYNVGQILSYTNLVFINGETITINDGKGVELTVKVTDDNGNTISGGEITFTVEDSEIDTINLVNGIATTKFTPHENGTLTVSGIYNGAYYDDYNEIYRVNLTNGTLEVSNAVPEYFGVIYVATNGDDGNDGSSDNPVKTLEQAIKLATRDGGSYSIVIREGTYKVSGYSFDYSINITGEGNPILDAENNNVIFTLTGKETTNFVFAGLTFANGKDSNYVGGGAISVKGGNLYLENNTFVNCTSVSYNGGALFISQGAMDYNSYPYVNKPVNAVIINCTFENNGNGKNYGGAVYVHGSNANAEIIDSTFKNNTAGSGGAIYVSSSSVNITNSKFIDNGATSEGSAVYLSGNAIIKNNEFTGNNVSSISISNSNNEITLESNTIESESTEILTNSLRINGITVTILNNETKSFFAGEITLTATVTDDNGNKISANNFYFIVNGTELSPVKLEDGVAEITYAATVDDNNAIVTAYGANDIKTAILNIVEYAVIITFEDANGNVGENINIPFTLVDSLNNPIYDNVSVKFNDETFSINASEGSISITLPETANTYDLTITYGEESLTKTVTVNPISTSIEANGITVHVTNDESLTAVLSDIENNPISDVSVTFKFDDDHSVSGITSADGSVSVLIPTGLASGNYDVNITFAGSDKYAKSEKIVTVTVETDVIVINLNEASGDVGSEINVPVNITLNGNLIGSESISYLFNDEIKSLDLVNGEGTITLTLPDVAGEYNLTVTYNDESVNKIITVNAAKTPEIKYTSTPVVNGESGIEYTKGDSKIITVTVLYDESSLSSSNLEYLKSGNMLIFINGAEGVAISNIASDNKSFTIDLADYSDSLVVGENNISFHPRTTLLETVFGNEDIFVFNNLTVSASEPIIPDYTGIIYVASSGSSDDNNGSFDNPVASIKKAIELASNKYNTEHKIIIREGTYEEFDLNIISALDISAEGNVVIDARELGRILNITADTNITGITFKNGKAIDGGAIYIKDAKVIIDNSKFYNNNGSSWGGAIYWDADNGRLTNSIFEENSARNGAAIQLGVYDSTTWKTSGKNGEIINCTFNNNDNLYNASGSIGVSVFGSGVIVKDSNFTNNHGRENSNHGALYIYGDDATVDNCLFENNTMDEGVGLHLDGDNVVVKNCKFINNTNYADVASRSGAIHIGDSANAEITGNIFIANGGSNCSSGGAINIVYNYYGGEIIISNNQFINNSAAYGGAICVDGGNNAFDLTINNNIFDGNEARYGAGVYLDLIDSSSAPTISNNEFKNNAANYGAGIYVSSYETVKLSQNTMNGNEIYLEEDTDIDGELTLTFSNHVAVVGESINLTATLVDDNGNLVSGVAITFKSGNNSIGENITVNGIATIEFIPSVAENYTISGSTSLYGDVTIKNGLITVNTQNTTGNNTNGTSGNGNTTVITKIATKITATSVTTTYNIAKNVVITLKDANSKVLSNKKITIKINGKTETKTTNAKGQVSISVNLPPKTYTASITFAGDGLYIKSSGSAKIIVNKATPKLTASKKSYKVKATKKYSATLKDNKGKVIKNAKITIKVNGKTYSAKTNSKGVVTFKLTKLTKKGNFNAVVKFAGNAYYNAISKTVKITVKK